MNENSRSHSQRSGRKSRSRLALPEGAQLGRYRIGDQLGAGGFGITYLAQDTQLNRPVAIKELLPTSIATRCNSMEIAAHTESEEDDWEWAQERFIQEAETVAACEHPNVLQVYEVFRANGTVYMVTRFEDGCNLEDWLRQLGCAPTEQELRNILLPILAALDRVHRRGFLHRDIKPENIYMASDGRPVLIDFGSARQKISHKSLPLTKIVTPGYAPFEQYLDDGHQGPFTDLYALGAVLYRAITDRKPPESPQRSRPGIPDECIRLTKTFAAHYTPEFLACIDAALAPEPEDRPQTAAEWIQKIESTSARSIPASVTTESPPRIITPRPQRSSRDSRPIAQLTLEPLEAGSGSVPIRLIATTEFRIGRNRESVDYVTWFWPRSTQNDGRTMRLGKVHLRIAEHATGILIENEKSTNSLTFNGHPLSDDSSMVLTQPGTLLLGQDYQLEITPFVSPLDDAKSRKIGAVRFTPRNSDFAFYQPVWILTDATFGRSGSNPIVLKSPDISEVSGRIYYHDGRFWLEAFPNQSEVYLDGRLLRPEDLLPLPGNHRLQIGSMEYVVVDNRT